jgi:hypothetical protein
LLQREDSRQHPCWAFTILFVALGTLAFIVTVACVLQTLRPGMGVEDLPTVAEGRSLTAFRIVLSVFAGGCVLALPPEERDPDLALSATLLCVVEGVVAVAVGAALVSADFPAVEGCELDGTLPLVCDKPLCAIALLVPGSAATCAALTWALRVADWRAGR